ncbi:hypothetical protein V8C42DRAFT_310509 [Trichoderma barbatum]
MANLHYDIPKKACIRGAFEWSELNAKKDLFRFSQCNSTLDRMRYNNLNKLETCDRKRALSDADSNFIEDFYEDEGFET